MEKQVIANKLKEARIAAGMTQKEVALSIGRPQQTVAAWETARSQPDADTLYSLLILYNVSPNSFFGYDITSMDVSSEERELLCTYRELDDFGKRLIRLIADEEAARCKPASSSVLSLPEDSVSKCLYLPLSEQPASAGTGVYLGPEAFRSIKVKENSKTKRTAFCVRVSGDSMEPIYADGDIVMVSKEPVLLDDIALVTLNGNGYIKRMGDMYLTSENKKYDPIPYDESVIVNGRVIGLLQPEWILDM